MVTCSSIVEHCHAAGQCLEARPFQRFSGNFCCLLAIDVNGRLIATAHVRVTVGPAQRAVLRGIAEIVVLYSAVVAVAAVGAIATAADERRALEQLGHQDNFCKQTNKIL